METVLAPIIDKYKPLYGNRSRFLILWGGAGSGKSVYAAYKKIRRFLYEPGHKFLCLRKVGATIRETIFDELKGWIGILGVSPMVKVNESNFEIRNLVNGNKIICKGLDEEWKVKSIKGITGMWVEESTDFTADDIRQLMIRIRGQHKHYVQYIFTFNGIDEDNAAVKMLITEQSEYIRNNSTILHTTYLDNPFLSAGDRETLESYKDSNQYYYDVYCLGKIGLLDKSNKFCYAYDEDTHVKPVELDKNYPIWLSFDFNKDPMTCIAGQKIGESVGRIERQFKLNQGSTPEMCDIILATFPDWNFFVTGDATGRSRSSLIRGNMNHIRYIQKALNLTQAQLKFRSINMTHIDSRLLCNMILMNTEMAIDPSCKDLRDQMKFAKVDEYGELIKDREENKNDLLDCWRYMVAAWYPRHINRMHKNYDRTPIHQLNGNNGNTYNLPQANGNGSR